jgi:endonuclease G
VAFARLAKKLDEIGQVLTVQLKDTPLTSELPMHRDRAHPPRTAGNAIARIVGGTPVGVGEFPECVLVGRRRVNGSISWFCSGVLVHPRIVLTAGHCFSSAAPANVVALSAEDVDDLQNAERRGGLRMRQHPQYPRTGFHDISVMILRRASTIDPVRLATAAELEQAANTTLVGFGNDDILSTRGFGIKREVTVPITNPPRGSGGPDDEQDTLGYDADLEFVAGGAGFDSCNGDSGGPAYIQVGGQRVLAGLTSRATDTARNPCGGGGIYTRVDVHAQFIRNVAAQSNINF